MTDHGPERVLLLGATGMLGGYLANYLPKHFITYSPAPRNQKTSTFPSSIELLSKSLDLSNLESVDEILEECKPDVIINCIAVTSNSHVTADSIENITVNSLFPQVLAMSASRNGCRLIHFSTDGVFSGKRGNYSECDLPDPPDIYGLSKLLGEVVGDNCLTLRTTFYGLSGNSKGLLDWLLTQKDGRVKGYKNYIFSGLSMCALASVIVAIIKKPIFPTGLYHLGGPSISKYELLTMFSERFKLNINFEPILTPIINRSLDSSNFWEMIGLDMPETVAMIDSIYLDPRSHVIADALKKLD